MKGWPLFQSACKSCSLLPELTCSKAASAALCCSPTSFSRQRCLRRGRRPFSRVFPSFSMLSNWQGSPELSQLFNCMFSQFLPFIIFCSLMAFQHIWSSEISLFVNIALIFLPDFSQKFSTHCYLQLPSLPHCYSFSLAANGLHGGFTHHVFIRHPPVTFLHLLFLAQSFVYLLYCSGSVCFGAVRFLLIARVWIYIFFQGLGFHLAKKHVSLFFLHWSVLFKNFILIK